MAGMQQADLLQERPETERSKFAMKCYHCDCELTDQDTCPTCGADVALYKKLMSLSNLYYNEGLEKATVRNLTGAAESLHQSL